MLRVVLRRAQASAFAKATADRRSWRSQRRWSACALVALLAITQVVASDRWPQFRGLQAGVADDDPALPETWSESENVAWKISVPGQSWSSPVVWGDHVFVTSAISSGTEPAPEKGIADPTPEVGRMKSAARHPGGGFSV